MSVLCILWKFKQECLYVLRNPYLFKILHTHLTISTHPFKKKTQSNVKTKVSYHLNSFQVLSSKENSNKIYEYAAATLLSRIIENKITFNQNIDLNKQRVFLILKIILN